MTNEFDEDPFYDPEDTLPTFTDAARAKLELVDRTTLERWATCPAMARILEGRSIRMGNKLTATGDEIHAAFSDCLTDYIEQENFAIQRREYVDNLVGRLRASRPDVQPEVLDAASRAVWAFTDLYINVNPSNILAYDGGEKTGRGGQFAVDLPASGVRYTSELDLLMAGPGSPEILYEHDYKSGHKYHDAVSISQSFQFQTHAFLVFDRFPDCEELKVSVFNVRTCRSERAVRFTREKDYENIAARIRTAIGIREQYRNVALGPEMCWPMTGRCDICDARKECPIEPPPCAKDDPEAALLALVAMQQKADALKDELTALVDATGEDIVAEGVAFGRSKPADRRAKAVLYELGSEDAPAPTRKAVAEKKPRTARTSKFDESLMDQVFANLSQSKGT